MSLATRCTACGTVFRVVQDQLKVSEGWVRCGRCESVFNALEGLLDLDREAPTGWDEAGAASPAPEPLEQRIEPAADVAAAQPAASPAAPSTTISAPPAAVAPRDGHRPEEGSPSIPNEFLADPIDAHLFGPRKRAESAPKPAGQIGARDRVEFSDARFDSDLFAENADPEEPESAQPSTVVAELPLESTERPEFIRRADRHARWRSRPIHALVTIAFVVAAATLALQIGHRFRDTLAAKYSSLRPVLSIWCRLADCVIEPPRLLEALTIESDKLALEIETGAYVLSVSVRNGSPFTLTMPAVELSLTDANGKLVARRVLSARDFRTEPHIAAEEEIPLQLRLGTGGTQITKYNVRIFYP